MNLIQTTVENENTKWLEEKEEIEKTISSLVGSLTQEKNKERELKICADSNNGSLNIAVYEKYKGKKSLLLKESKEMSNDEKTITMWLCEVLQIPLGSVFPFRVRFVKGAAVYAHYFTSPLREIGIFVESSGPKAKTGRQCVTCGENEFPASHSGKFLGTKFVLCECEGVWYCSEACQNRYWEEEHSQFCASISEHVKKKQKLKNELPFPYVNEASRDFALFLKEKKLHRKGFWKFECECCCVEFDGLLPEEKSVYLPESQLPSIYGKPAQVVDWLSYCQQRGIPLDSPLPILMSFPLTVFHILASKIETPKIDAKEITIHYLGPEKEVAQIGLWPEILHFFPNVNINIIMIGPVIPSSLDKTTNIYKGSMHNSLTISFECTFYHKYFNGQNKPDVIMGLNAGFAAYSTWEPTLQVLAGIKVPMYFTDYCENSCNACISDLGRAGIECNVLPEVNPFRVPYEIPIPSLNVPYYSNGFLYGFQPP